MVSPERPGGGQAWGADTADWIRSRGAHLVGLAEPVGADVGASTTAVARSLGSRGYRGAVVEIGQSEPDEVRERLRSLGIADEALVTTLWVSTRHAAVRTFGDLVRWYDDWWYPSSDDVWGLDPTSLFAAKDPADGLLPGAFAVFAAGPAARPALAFLELLAGPTDAALPRLLLLGVFDPADELVAGQRRDVVPGGQDRGVGEQRLPQISGKLVHHPTGYLRAAHEATVAGQGGGDDSAFRRGQALRLVLTCG